MIEEFTAVLNAFKNEKINVYEGVVESVDKENCTCVVQRNGDLPELLDVRLNAVEGSFENSIVIFPKKGSQVLCSIIENNEAETTIIKYTEIDSVEVKIKGLEFILQDGKCSIKNENSDLKKLFQDTLKQLSAAKILTPAGPGNFSPDDINKFTEISNNADKLFM